MCLLKKHLQSLFTAPGHQPPAPLSSPLHPRNASWNSKPAEPWRSQRFREISYIIYIYIYIYLFYIYYVYILLDMSHDIRMAELEVKCLPGRRSPRNEFPFNLLWTSFRMMEDSPWERKHFELPWIIMNPILQKLPSSERIGAVTQWTYVKICENVDAPLRPPFTTTKHCDGGVAAWFASSFVSRAEGVKMR